MVVMVGLKLGKMAPFVQKNWTHKKLLHGLSHAFTICRFDYDDQKETGAHIQVNMVGVAFE